MYVRIKYINYALSDTHGKIHLQCITLYGML